MPAKVDRTKRIVEQARRAVEQSGAATLAVGGDGGTQGTPGGQSIQDGDGRMRWMWGVSVWGGEDVFSDG